MLCNQSKRPPAMKSSSSSSGGGASFFFFGYSFLASLGASWATGAETEAVGAGADPIFLVPSAISY